jgi:CelD/BcsL family acetyltransferase involved in cellulose biosynthesis
MREFKRLHALRMIEKGLPSKFSDPDYERFHDRVSETLLRAGRLFAADLRLDGKTVAGRYSFLYDNKIYDYQTGFDPAFAPRGVMQALISYIVEDAVNTRFRELDFLSGGEDYKRHFSTSTRRIFTVRFYNRTSAGWLYRLADRRNRALKT